MHDRASQVLTQAPASHHASPCFAHRRAGGRKRGSGAKGAALDHGEKNGEKVARAVFTLLCQPRLTPRPRQSACWWPTFISPQKVAQDRLARASEYGGGVSTWTDEFKEIVARARADADVAGELHPRGPAHVELPESVREAIGKDLRNGAYEQAARESTAGDPEMTQF